jgi:predicted nuclease of predicted toxin-antitoxin system
MRVILDHNVPAPLRQHLKGHELEEAVERGWERLKNGDLLTASEDAGFDVFVTSDKNIRHQQNLAGRKIAIIVLRHGQWPSLQPHVQRVLETINAATRGSYKEVEIPLHKNRIAPRRR